jgi:hypothetical protein
MTRQPQNVIFTTDQSDTFTSALRRIRHAGIKCEVRTATIWKFGMPRTSHEISVADFDEHRARALVAGIPQEIPSPAITRAQKIWIITGLSAIVVVVVVQLVMLLLK